MNKWLLLITTSLIGLPVSASDPTRPANMQPIKETQVVIDTLKLTMVRMMTDKPSATINGQLLHVGDTIAGYQVAKITAEQVLLTNAKGRLKLNLITKGALRKSS